jgi:PAS domain S-box-containing protein
MGGYLKREVIGQDFRKLLHKDSMGLVQGRYLSRLGGKNPPRQYVLKAVRKDGETRNFELKASRIFDKYGKVRIVAQLLDVTENGRIEDERKHFEERLSALNKYGQSLNMAKSLKEIHAVTLEAMEKTLGFEYASILKVEGKTLRLMCNRGYSKDLSLRLPLDGEKGVTVRAAKTGKPICVKNLEKEEKYIIGKPGMRSELAIPVKDGKRVLSVLNVESERPAAFNGEDVKLLEILASHTATALTNLNRQKRLSALNAYGKSLNMAENLNTIYRQTLNAMERTLGFEFATFFVVEEKKLRLAAHRGYPKRLSVTLSLDGNRGVSLRTARIGKPVFVHDIRKEKTYISGRPGMLSELAVPIKIGHKVLGVLNVESERLVAFDENDREMLEILASHAATAMVNLNRRDQFRNLSSRLEYLMRNTTEIIHARNMRQRLKVITKAICKFGWRRVVISLRDENLEGTDTVTAGLTKEETMLLMKRKAPGHVWQERLGLKFERFKIGEFYYLPWNDPWVRENVHGVPPETPTEKVTTYAGVPSRLSTEKMVDWHPQDMLYAPLRTPEGRIVGILSMDDPTDGRKPTRGSLVPLELFLHQAAIIIENARLFESLRQARQQLEAYAGQLGQKVQERTRELRISQEQLLKAQRLAVIGELAGMVGHDLRNPLTSIAGATYYMKKRLIPKIDGKIEKMLELIENNISYSNKIINDLLDYSRELKLEMTETTPALTVKEALSLVEIPKNIKLVNLAENNPKMRVDVGKIKRCFVNILKNAVDAMPNGGKLTIECNRIDDKMRFLFSDTGVGMSKETIAKLWTPLFTTKAKGMGFGLPICKRIAEAHGGLVAAKSVLKKGTTFAVTLPIRSKPKGGGEELWVKTLESSLLTTTRT